MNNALQITFKRMEKVSAVSPALDGVEDRIVDFESLNTCKSTSLTYSVFHLLPSFYLLLERREDKLGPSSSRLCVFQAF